MFMIWTFISFLVLDCTDTTASVSGDSHVMEVKKGILVLLVSLLRGRIEQ